MQRNVAVFADGEVDRSPCGSGTSARLALLDASGELPRGQELRHLQHRRQRVPRPGRRRAEVAGRPAVVTEVEGSAHRTGEHRFVLEDARRARHRLPTAIASPCGRGRDQPRRRRPHDHAQSAGRPQRVQRGDAQGARRVRSRRPASPEIRAVVITGAGRGFCVGQDLTEFRETPSDIGDRLRSSYHPNITAIRALEKPVIAAVNGAAAGAGCRSRARAIFASPRTRRSSCRRS